MPSQNGSTPLEGRRHRGRSRHDDFVPLQSVPQNERRQVILERIAGFLNRRGSSESDWTLSQLARAADTSRVTLYHYFENLEGLRTAVRNQLVGQIEPIVATLDTTPTCERHLVAVSLWMNWIGENRKLAIRALWVDELNPAFATFVTENANSLIRQIADVFLGVRDPSEELLLEIEIYLRAAEACLRMWLLEGRMKRAEVQATIERLTQDVVRMGETRSDVPKPMPGQAG